jgi:hypothetical protein
MVYKYIEVKIYKIIMVPVALYGCETWSLKLMGKHRLRVLSEGCLEE